MFNRDPYSGALLSPPYWVGRFSSPINHQQPVDGMKSISYTYHYSKETDISWREFKAGLLVRSWIYFYRININKYENVQVQVGPLRSL